jgi:hypothetical protein
VRVRRNLHDVSFSPFVQSIEKRSVTAVEFVGRPRHHFDPVGLGLVDQVQCDLWFRFEYHIIGNVVFFRRAGSSAHSLGRYSRASSPGAVQLEVCNPTWEIIVALCRYGGLRCPSEVLSLKWEHVDWEHSRIWVQSPKTEHHPGKDQREMPLFRELRPYLESAFEQAKPGGVYVVGVPAGVAYRNASFKGGKWRNCNLCTQFARLVKRAGLEPWSSLIRSLRSSRETELVHAVCAWLGNTPRIALKHYLQVYSDNYFAPRVASSKDVTNIRRD